MTKWSKVRAPIKYKSSLRKPQCHSSDGHIPVSRDMYFARKRSSRHVGPEHFEVELGLPSAQSGDDSIYTIFELARGVQPGENSQTPFECKIEYCGSFVYLLCCASS